MALYRALKWRWLLNKKPLALCANDMKTTGYRGRFAPSPTGPLHAGSLVAALASWLDARAGGGQWLVRIEDVDTSRCLPGADKIILAQLNNFGLVPDAEPVYQSQRTICYQHALNELIAKQRAYPCGCTRHSIEQTLADAGQPRLAHDELVYNGTCRNGLHGQTARAWRFLTSEFKENRAETLTGLAQAAIKSIAPETANTCVHWHDRRLGAQTQNVSHEVGDFVLKRGDGFWAYQLAVVVDDAAQGITDIVRGEDLADSTARQILLQRALGLPLPRYLHTPLVLNLQGEKISKQHGAVPLDTAQPITTLQQAGHLLGLKKMDNREACTLADWLQQAVRQWSNLSHIPAH